MAITMLQAPAMGELLVVLVPGAFGLTVCALDVTTGERATVGSPFSSPPN